MTEQMTGAQSLIRSLEQVGVDTVFGIPGGAILPAYDPLYDSAKVRHILMRPNAPLLTSCDRYALTQFTLDTSSATCAPFATGILQFTCTGLLLVQFNYNHQDLLLYLQVNIVISKILNCVACNSRALSHHQSHQLLLRSAINKYFLV